MTDVLPLSGIRVVSLEQAVAAPFCARQLADNGADVIKIERPDGGDPARGYDRALRGESAYFAWLNRGKRSIVLDLKQPRDHDVCRRLLERADVFIHNTSPGAVERMGFGYKELSANNPKLIWLGISGYGPNGPYRDKKAYDMLVQAESGVVSITGTEEFPAKVGVSVADIASGMYSFSSILTALLNRARTGKGERIDISMLECLTEWMMPALYVWKGQGMIPARMGVRHNLVVPYGAYPCSDGDVMLAVVSEREWQRFCSGVMHNPSLAADARFASNDLRLKNRDALESLIEERFRGRTRAEVGSWLERADIPTAHVNDVPAIAAHPQLAARNRWVEVESPSGPIPALLPPHNLMHVRNRMGAVPALGEHTDEILAEIA